tara:strand:- start:410 stop:697 length:288 start_codon:yes stop_codon:yes gene_type:complete
MPTDEYKRMTRKIASLSCDRCGLVKLKPAGVVYTAPAYYGWVCENCGRGGEIQGDEGINILEGEEAVRKRPQFYLDSDNPEWRKIAEESMKGLNE